MTERTHTPGPWSVSCIRTRIGGEPVLQILGADQKAYALVFYSDRKPGEHQASYADANLIAAAPDLLASGKALLERYRIMGCGEGPEAYAMRMAIEKATPKSQSAASDRTTLGN